MQKVLETANIKLAAVVTDILGKSSCQMIEALLDGQTDPTALAQLARSRLRTKIPQLSLALEGHLDDHHILLLRQLLAQIDFLTAQMLSLEQAVEARLPPFQESLNLLVTIPAISRTSAIIILSEIGENMSLFPSAAHLASWAGVVRCITRLNIPGTARKNSKGGSWVTGLPHIESLWGTVACH